MKFGRCYKLLQATVCHCFDKLVFLFTCIICTVLQEYGHFRIILLSGLIYFIQSTNGFLPTKCTGSDVIICYNQTYIDPKSFPSSMVELQVSSSDIGNLRKRLLQDLVKNSPDLKTFKITTSSIRYIHTCSLSSVSNMSQILIQDSRVDTIVHNAFSDLKYIQNIEFINVDIKEISKLAFHGVQGVGRFIMDGMRVGTMRYASFAELKDVKELLLTNSYIQLMEQQPIVNQKSISSLVIRGNTINSTLCGFDSLLQTFTNNNITCNTDTDIRLMSAGNNKCFRNLKNSCPPVKDPNVVKHSYGCRGNTLDEGIPPVSEDEIFDRKKTTTPSNSGSSTFRVSMVGFYIFWSYLT